VSILLSSAFRRKGEKMESPSSWKANFQRIEETTEILYNPRARGGLDGPGSMYGQLGEGYSRIAPTHSAERLNLAMTRMARFLG
jgi:hypothetical protein